MDLIRSTLLSVEFNLILGMSGSISDGHFHSIEEKRTEWLEGEGDREGGREEGEGEGEERDWRGY